MLVEVLVRWVDKTSADSRHNSSIMKRGDVVVICPAGWKWSKRELNNSDWRILKVDLAPTVIDSLMHEEEGEFADRIPRKRKYQIDIDGLETDTKAIISANPEKVADLSAKSDDVVGQVKLKGAITVAGGR